MPLKIDVEKFENDVYREIAKGNTTSKLIAQSLKISQSYAAHRLNVMVDEGKIDRKVVDRVSYYIRGEYRAHDPFFLCTQPVGDLDGLIRQSHASP